MKKPNPYLFGMFLKWPILIAWKFSQLRRLQGKRERRLQEIDIIDIHGEQMKCDASMLLKNITEEKTHVPKRVNSFLLFWLDITNWSVFMHQLHHSCLAFNAIRFCTFISKPNILTLSVWTLDGTYARMYRVVLNFNWEAHPTISSLYGQMTDKRHWFTTWKSDIYSMHFHMLHVNIYLYSLICFCISV